MFLLSGGPGRVIGGSLEDIDTVRASIMIEMLQGQRMPVLKETERKQGSQGRTKTESWQNHR